MKELQNYIYHIISQEEWNSVKMKQNYYPASLENEGFIHFSFKEQVKDVASRFYSGQQGLMLLKIFIPDIVSPLKIDLVENDGNFPHLYGPLNLDAVKEVYPLTLENDNSFSWQEG